MQPDRVEGELNSAMNSASPAGRGVTRAPGGLGLETTPPRVRFGLCDQATFCLALAFLISILVPQLNPFWLRGSCPLFAAWFLLSLGNGGFLRARKRIEWPLALVGLFTGVLVLNWVLRDGPNSKQFITGFVNVAASTMIMGYYAVTRPNLLPVIRWLVAVVFGVALLPSLPVLYSNPWAARFLSSADAWDLRLADPEVVSQGVGTYIQYTGIALVMSAMIASAFENGPIRRSVLIGALVVLAASVMLAMFMMASVLLLSAVVISAAVMPFLLRYRYRWVAVSLAATALLALPGTIDVLCDKYDAVQYVHDKFLRLVSNISEVGLEQGDDSTRVDMLIDTWSTVVNNPWLGVGFDSGNGAGTYIGGHSSLVDHWAMFGLLGYAPFFLLQVHFTRVAVANWLDRRRDVVAWGSVYAWGVTGWRASGIRRRS